MCCFRAIKIINTYLRSRLTVENMQGLSTTYIHKDIPINTDEVVSHYTLKKLAIAAALTDG